MEICESYFVGKRRILNHQLTLNANSESSLNITWRSVRVNLGREAKSESPINIAWRSVRITLGRKARVTLGIKANYESSVNIS